jgi:hypothetical protein
VSKLQSDQRTELTKKIKTRERSRHPTTEIVCGLARPQLSLTRRTRTSAKRTWAGPLGNLSVDLACDPSTPGARAKQRAIGVARAGRFPVFFLTSRSDLSRMEKLVQHVGKLLCYFFFSRHDRIWRSLLPIGSAYFFFLFSVSSI